MKKNAQLFWGLATIVGAVVVLLWFFGFLRRLLFWFRFKLIPSLILTAIVIAILYLGWAIFFGKEEN